MLPQTRHFEPMQVPKFEMRMVGAPLLLHDQDGNTEGEKGPGQASIKL